MAMMLHLPAILATVAQALVWSPTVMLEPLNSLDNGSHGACRVPGGKLLFLHIMKAGGTSVDSFLACHCERVGCSMKLSLGTYHDLYGNTNCDQPAICSTHGDYKERKELCGDAFEHPTEVFTVFREPISRVFSLYNYEKAQGESLPTIAEIYHWCDKEIANDTISLFTTSINWLCDAMTNHMTLKTFASTSFLYSSKMNKAALGQAKSVVASLNATIFMDDFNRFAEAFTESSLIRGDYTNPQAKRCELGHSNPTECPTCAGEPTAAEAELIKQHNEMDMALYNYAANLPNRRKGWTVRSSNE
jgi:hypothetical protein